MNQKILFIGNPSIHNLFREILIQEGYDSQFAKTDEVGIGFLSAGEYKVAILDPHVYSSYGECSIGEGSDRENIAERHRNLREITLAGEVPLVIFSAFSKDSLESSLGFTHPKDYDYLLQMPEDPDTIIETIKNAEIQYQE